MFFLTVKIFINRCLQMFFGKVFADVFEKRFRA